jgi:CheY-like chemotaxis protein
VTAKVLIVDDSSEFRSAAAELLVERGLTVLATVADAEEAAAAVAVACPDGILLDVYLAGTDGFTVATVLATACPKAKIVLTSANLTQLPDELLRASAATAFVPKEALSGADLPTLFRPEDA